jgi:hypothetical protein
MTSGGACASSIKTPLPEMGASVFPLGWIEVMLCLEWLERLNKNPTKLAAQQKIANESEKQNSESTGFL